MGNSSNAAVAYSKAASLLYFLVVEAAYLPNQPPLLLSPMDRHRLRRYADAVTARQHQCTAAASGGAHQDDL
jgi:serine/threonine-protein kinase ULK/ATG1